MSSQWPPPEVTIDRLLAVARSYALDLSNVEHPEDVANALTTAIEVAWRTIKPVSQ